MVRMLSRLLVIPALFALLSLAAPASGQGAEIDMTGVWKGTYSVANGEANATVTIKNNGGKYSGTIALTDENINISIRNGGMDDEYFAVSGVFPSKTPDGKTVQAHFTFGGFVEPDGGMWEGNWTIGDKDGNVVAGNLFSFTREGGSGKPETTGGDIAISNPPQKPNTGGLVGTKPNTPKPEPAKPVGGSDAKPATGGTTTSAASMAGRWEGTYTQTNKQAGTLSIELQERGGSYKGSGQAVDNDGTEIPPITFASGKMTGKRFALDGTMTLVTEYGEEFPGTVSLSGDATGDAWRGNILVKTEIEGEDTTVISGMFKLERKGGASSPPSKQGSGSPGISGGGMSGRGKAGNVGK